MKIEVIKHALDVLGLPPFVSFNEIKKQYRYLSKSYHPDINEENSKMADLNEAYEILKVYTQNYRFSFSDEEILKQFPESEHARKFKF
jgi:DnaJ-class molecular chaperone